MFYVLSAASARWYIQQQTAIYEAGKCLLFSEKGRPEFTSFLGENVPFENFIEIQGLMFVFHSIIIYDKHHSWMFVNGSRCCGGGRVKSGVTSLKK